MRWKVGRRFKREGTYVYLWLIHLMYSRNQHIIIKQLFSIKRKTCQGQRSGMEEGRDLQRGRSCSRIQV